MKIPMETASGSGSGGFLPPLITFPAHTRAEYAAIRAANARRVAGGDCCGTRIHAARRPARWEPRRDPVSVEVYCDFARLAAELEDTETAVARRLRALLREYGAAMVAQAAAVFADGRVRDIAAIAPPDGAAEACARVVSDELGDLVGEGRRSVRAEVAAQLAGRVVTAPKRVRAPEPVTAVKVSAAIRAPITTGADKAVTARINQWLAVNGRTVADGLLAQFRRNFLVEVARQAQFGEFDAQTLTEFYEGLGDSPIRQQVRLVTSDALAVGRRAEMETYKGQIATAYYSTMLDSGVCPQCRALEGHEVEAFSAEYELIFPPLIDAGTWGSCDGRGNCRCLLILRLKSEAVPLV